MLEPGQTLTLSRGGLILGTSVGVVQYSAVPETIKDTMVMECGVPLHFVLPPDLFSAGRGISLAELEFPAYYNFFLKQSRTHVICRSHQRDELVKILSRSLFGPESLDQGEFDGHPFLRAEDLKAEIRYFARHPKDHTRQLALDDLVEFHEFDSKGRAELGPRTALCLEHDGGFSLVENGSVKVRIKVRPPLPPMVLEADSRETKFHRPVLGVSVIGSGHGFDAGNRTCGFIVWVDGKGIMVDPPVDSVEWLRGYDVPAKQVDTLILTHCHADHDAGTLQKILQEGRVTLYTTPTIKQNFVEKYATLTGMTSQAFSELFDFIPVRTEEPVNLNGAEVTFHYSLHAIPCMGFEIAKGGKSLVYPSDTLNHPGAIEKLHAEGILSPGRRDQLLNFPWHHSLVLHEAGIPPIHTPLEYLDTLPLDVKRRMFLVHVSSKQLQKTRDLSVAPTGLENTIDLKASRERIYEPVELLDTISRVDLLSELPLSRAGEFLRMVRRERYKAGQKIVAEGDPGDAFYIILAGKVAVMQGGAAIKTYAEYDYFGETALVLNQPRNADVLAITDVTLLTISQSDFLHLVRGTDLTKSLAHLAHVRDLPTWPLLQACRHLGNPTSNQLTQLQQIMEPLELPPGPVPEGLCGILSSGTVEARRKGHEILVLGRAAFVGDVRALSGKRRSPYEFVATGAVEGYSFKKAGLRIFLHKNPGIYLNLRAVLPASAKA